MQKLGILVGTLSFLFAFGIMRFTNKSMPRKPASFNIVPFDVSIEGYADFITNASITNLQDAVLALDEPFFDLPNYALVYESRSIQPSSLKFPRMILFGQDVKLGLAFNHRLGNDNTIEAIQWRDAGRKWELFEMSIDARGAHLSAPNPARCLKCHGGADPRPNFDEYKTWTGFYGSQQEFHFFPAREIAGWTEFYKNANQDPIYKRLKFPSNNLAEYGYSPDIAIEFRQLEHLNGEMSILFRYLMNLNAQRIARILSENTQQRSLGLVYAGIAANCAPEQFISDPQFLNNLEVERQKFDRTELYDYHRMLTRLLKGNFDLADQVFAPDKYQIYGYGLQHTENIIYLMRLSAVLKTYTGINIDNWSLSFAERESVLSDSSGNQFWFSQHDKNTFEDIVSVYESIVKEFKFTDVPRVPPYERVSYRYQATADFCQNLAKKFSGFPPPVRRVQKISAPEYITDSEVDRLLGSRDPIANSNIAKSIVTKSCSECHSSTGVQAYPDAPLLPLENLQELADWHDGRAIDMLRTRIMPKAGQYHLSEKERAILIDTLQTLWMKPVYDRYIQGKILEDPANGVEISDFQQWRVEPVHKKPLSKK